MDTQPQAQCHPVEISALDLTSPARQVHVMRRSGSIDPWPCVNDAELEDAVQQSRPDTNLSDPDQVHWADHPWEWSGV